MIEVGLTFMDLSQEYRVVFKNDEKNRISIEPIGDFIRMPQLNEKIIIDNTYYIVTYIKEGQKRITLDLIRKDG
jgi:hypothetical protein